MSYEAYRMAREFPRFFDAVGNLKGVVLEEGPRYFQMKTDEWLASESYTSDAVVRMVVKYTPDGRTEWRVEEYEEFEKSGVTEYQFFGIDADTFFETALPKDKTEH